MIEPMCIGVVAPQGPLEHIGWDQGINGWDDG